MTAVITDTFAKSRDLLSAIKEGNPEEKISVRHLNFYYQDGNRALRDVSVPIFKHQVTAFTLLLVPQDAESPRYCGSSIGRTIFIPDNAPKERSC